MQTITLDKPYKGVYELVFSGAPPKPQDWERLKRYVAQLKMYSWDYIKDYVAMSFGLNHREEHVSLAGANYPCYVFGVLARHQPDSLVQDLVHLGAELVYKSDEFWNGNYLEDAPRLTLYVLYLENPPKFPTTSWTLEDAHQYYLQLKAESK